MSSVIFVVIAVGCASAGIYLFFLGFRMLRFKRLILNTPLSHIHSASIGLVEVTGTPVGPQVLSAPITGDPCYYYRVQAWQWVESNNKHEWSRVLDESLCVPFFLEDGTGRLLIDPCGASMDMHRNFTDEVGLFALQSPNLVPPRLREFLATRGLVPSEKIKLGERIIPQHFPLFVFGTLGENPTGNSWAPRPQPQVASPASFQFQPGGGTFTFRMTSRRELPADKLLAFADVMNRLPATQPETRVYRSDVPGIRASVAVTTMVSTPLSKATSAAAIPPAPLAAISPTNESTPREFDLHPSVCIGKGQRNEPFSISAQSQREVVGRLAWKSVACIWGGPALALVSIYFLKACFEWFL